jgi:hypothetical protein
MTEIAQPLTSAPTETVTVVAQPDADVHAISFAELVFTRLLWWRLRQQDPLADSSSFDNARAAFQKEHGEIVGAYWCRNVASAVALTEQKRLRGHRQPVWGFHRETDSATQTSPDIACELHRCDELAVRASSILTGVRQRICMQLVVASAGHLLSIVDARAEGADEPTTEAAIVQERREISKAESYFREAANGQAQMVYFAGMATVALAISLVAAIWLAIDWASPVAAMIAGAVGAVVSVIQRITSGKFSLEVDVGRPYIFFLGGLRPLIGGAFAMAVCFAFSGGLLHLPVAANETTDHRHLALLVLGFMAGFSERWAQDALTTVVPESRPQPPSTHTAGTVATEPEQTPS